MCGRTQVWSHIIHWQACCIEIQSNLRRKKLHRVNQGSNFLGDTFSNRDNVRAPIQFRWESQPIILKDDFSSKIDPSIFISIAPALLDWSNATSWVFSALKSTSHFPSPQCLINLTLLYKVLLCGLVWLTDFLEIQSTNNLRVIFATEDAKYWKKIKFCVLM